MILYHAISAFQILEVILHRQKYYKHEKCILILPDFITSKYPNYTELKLLGFFDEVYLFSYMAIPHNEETVFKDTCSVYEQTIPYKLEAFDNCYIAGAHFYFSLLLINKKIRFSAFEDAAGMLSQGERLYYNLHRCFPVHADIIYREKLFSLENSYIKEIICNKKLNSFFPAQKKITDFDIRKVLKRTPRRIKKKLYTFYNISNLTVNFKNKILIITQNFTAQGIMSVAQQIEIYRMLIEKIHKPVVIKVHPDDEIPYEEIFTDAAIIRHKVPLEILPEKLYGTPELTISFSSTSQYYIKNRSKNINFKEVFSNSYDISNEYESIINILKEN